LLGLLAAVQAAHTDLKSTHGAVLVTGGALSLEQDAMTQLAVDMGMMTLAVSKAAQRKLVHILAKTLATEGIYVAEVTVAGMVKGTAIDPEGKRGTLTPEEVAEEFMQLLGKRDPGVWDVVLGRAPSAQDVQGGT
jgi:hypothetical protein